MKETNIGPRDYKVSDIKRLFLLSGNECSKPECKSHLIADDEYTVIAKICHIEAAKEGGPRFRKSMNDDQRRSFDNLIILCDEHHQVIDSKLNESKYSVDLLKEWKEKHTTKNKTEKLKLVEGSIEKFIQKSKEHYIKIEALDGPYKPMVSEYYVERETERELLSAIKIKGCLLLTGSSFCGKSEMAKKIAHVFFEDGYLYKRVSNTRDAASFLESIGKRRICFLEDPFGHKIDNIKTDEFKRVLDLLLNIPANNLLIITSRKELVCSIFDEQNLNKCNIDTHEWNDITSDDNSFLLNVWDRISAGRNLKEENIQNVKSLFSSGKSLQPGQLTHLAKLPELKIKEFNADKLYALAQVEAREIRKSIADINENAWLVFLIIGLSCDTINGCSFEDLEYILDSQKKKLSLEPKRDTIKSFIERDDNNFVFPDYSKNENKIEIYEPIIGELEERGYINFENEKYVFSHPQYKEIAKGFISNLSSIRQRKLGPFVYNALTCINSEVAYNVSKNLLFVSKEINQSFLKG